jgi:molecular chaperone DnaK
MTPDIVGIDIGTSSCSVAMMIDGKPQVLPVFEGRDEVPTYVAFAEDGSRLVGWAAKRQSVTNPANTIFTIKRLIGRKIADAATQEELGLLPYRVISSFSGTLWIEAGGKSYTPTEITAIMLAEVRRATESYLDLPVKQAVITVPAYFDLSQIQATVDAAEIAGIEVLRTIAEPTAAALAYGFADDQYSGLTAVYDLGGGTFDFSILELGDGVFEVKALSGHNRLGGEDFDHLLVNFFVDQIRKEHGVDLSSDALALHRIKDAAEQIKVELDGVNTATRVLPYLTKASGELFNANLKVTRVEIEQLFDDLITRTLAPCAQALRDAYLLTSDVRRLVLVGGMSRMPAIRRRVSEFFGMTPKRQLDPSRIVAHGAAIHGGVLSGRCKNVLLLDVTPLPLGLETPAGEFVQVISRNTTIPTLASIIIGTEDEECDLSMAPASWASFARSQRIRIVQEGAESIDRLLLDELEVDLSGLIESTGKILKVTFDIYANFRLHVSVESLTDGRTLLDEAVSVSDPFGRSQRFSEEYVAATRAQADQLLNIVAATLNARGKLMPAPLVSKITEASALSAPCKAAMQPNWRGPWLH